MERDERICSFFGHREIAEKEKISKKVEEIVKALIERGVKTFLFGGFGEFDALCHKVVSAVKEKNPTIKRVFCLTDERHLNKYKRSKFLREEDYEEFIYLSLSFDYWYTRIYYRNCEMIKQSDFIVFYATKRENSGAYKALQYAIKQKKENINIFDQI
ncbi:MAG: hypothetical protein IJY21_02105 [Clostridia bacterium]|nr:hypothetical protein [Clostridia bacterium]